MFLWKEPSLQPPLLPSLLQFQQQWHQSLIPPVAADHAPVSSQQLQGSFLHFQPPDAKFTRLQLLGCQTLPDVSEPTRVILLMQRKLSSYNS